MTTIITQAQGDCSSDTGLVTTFQVLVIQSGRDVTIVIPTSPVTRMAGQLIPPLNSSNPGNNWLLVFSGSMPDTGGTVTVSYRLELTSSSTMSGLDNWQWTNGITTCYNGQSSVTVSK